MTIKAAIAQAAAMRPNTVPGETQADWLIHMDGQLAELLGVEPVHHTWPEDEPGLMMPAPFDDIYTLHLVAQIDLYHEELEKYQIDQEVFQHALGGAMAWWRRNHLPKPSGGWKVM